MSTLSDIHLLAKDIKKAHDYSLARNFNRPKQHLSPLHKLIYKFRLDSAKMEKILTMRHKAAIGDETAPEELQIYLNRSAVEGRIEAAIVLTREGEIVDKLSFHLRNDDEYMVYEGEVVRIILVVELLRRAGEGQTMALGMNNQALIWATKVCLVHN